MPNQPRPQVVVVTGASGGIGRAIAHAFAKRGAHLGLLARGQPGLEAAAEEVRSLGGRAIVIPTDMTDPELVEAAADAVEARFGSIDAWVNDAMATVFARVVDTHPEEFKRATEVTYLGTGPPSTTAASCGSASPPYKQSRATNWRPGSPTATSPNRHQRPAGRRHARGGRSPRQPVRAAPRAGRHARHLQRPGQDTQSAAVGRDPPAGPGGRHRCHRRRGNDHRAFPAMTAAGRLRGRATCCASTAAGRRRTRHDRGPRGVFVRMWLPRWDSDGEQAVCKRG
jgi:NAD(P)-dependent dehydrogenase (short-subunit alcohol dehydrogenase family)